MKKPDKGIHKRLMMLGVVPTLVSTLFLVIAFVGYFYRDLNRALSEKASTVARYVSLSSEFGLATGNRELLSILADSVLKDRYVVRVEIRDDRNRVLASAGRNEHTGSDDEAYRKYQKRQGDYLLLETPVYQTRIHIDRFQDGEAVRYSRTGKRLGSVRMVYTRKYTRQRQQAIIGVGVLVGLVVMLVSLLVAKRVASGIASPIMRLSEAVERMTRGDLGARTEAGSYGEIGLLESGFNKMGESLQEAQTSLQEKVEHATRNLRETMRLLEIKNEALLEERERARLANQAKSQFLANMSHELRTPLNAIIGYAEMLEESDELKDFPQVREDLGKILISGRHLLTLINDVLDLSKIESGGMEVHAEEFSLRQLIDDIRVSIEPQMQANGNRLEIDCSSNIIMHSDELKLRQILINLLGNAARFTENGSVSLHAGSKNDDVEIIVKDSGIGMTPNTIGKLFRPFMQADSSTTRKYGGTGLGLALCRKYVEMLGGSIAVESEIGKGSVFTITIPKKYRVKT